MCAVCDCLVPVGHEKRYRKRLAVRESTLRRPRISHYLEHACQHNASELTPEISRTARVTCDLGAGLECAFITRNQSTTAARAAAAELQYIYTRSHRCCYCCCCCCRCCGKILHAEMLSTETCYFCSG